VIGQFSQEVYEYLEELDQMNWSARRNVLNQYLRNTSIGTTVTHQTMFVHFTLALINSSGIKFACSNTNVRQLEQCTYYIYVYWVNIIMNSRYNTCVLVTNQIQLHLMSPLNASMFRNVFVT
jgi:hypothetical protein